MIAALPCRPILAPIAAFLVLMGCEQTRKFNPDDDLAKRACLQFTADAFGITTDRQELDDIIRADRLGKVIHFKSDGQFIVLFTKLRMKGLNRQIILSCSGNFDSRTISNGTIDTVSKKPEKPEDWAF